MTALRFALLGNPVAHSKSPLLHAAAYRALGLPHTYEALATEPNDLEARVDALRRGDFAGLNVTVPYKQRVLDFVDERDDSVELVLAANTLVRTPEGRVRAYNTDAPALAVELVELARAQARSTGEPEPLAPSPFEGKTAVVVGSGGAARAAMAALAKSLGVARLVVRARAFDDPAAGDAFRTDMLASFARANVLDTAITTEPLVAPPIEAADLAAVVQATSCGMEGAAPGEPVARAVAWQSVPDDAVALDVVYAPLDTPFLRAAGSRGLSNTHGLGMLARQGALAFERWLGVPAPFDVMLAAIARPPCT